MGILQDGFQLFAGGHARDILFLIAGVDLVLDGGHTDHEELIQVGSGYAQEFQSLKERVLLVPGFAQTSAVELQPAQFPVRIVRGIVIFFSACYCHDIPLTVSSV